MTFVLDASCLLCFIFNEPGTDRVVAALDDAIVSAVNYSEAIAKLVERQADPERAFSLLAAMNLVVVAFDQRQAEAAGQLRATTRSAGLSLGDRACLALALTTGHRALTTDHAWERCATGVGIDFAR